MLGSGVATTGSPAPRYSKTFMGKTDAVYPLIRYGITRGVEVGDQAGQLLPGAQAEELDVRGERVGRRSS